MVRTQLYLDDDLRRILHKRARAEGTTLSGLVREAVRERYLNNRDERQEAMRAFVGVRGGRLDSTSSVEYVRSLRRGSRIERLGRK